MSLAKRDEFLIAFYNNVWLNVRRAETSLWVLVPLYFTILTGFLIYRKEINIFITTFLILILSISFSCITFNLNLWFVRNMRLVSRAEREFLDPKKDYNRVIPEKWIIEHIKFFTTEPYCIFGFAYLLIGIASTVFFLIFASEVSLTQNQMIILISSWVLLLLGEIAFVNKLRKRYNKNINETL